MSKYIDIEKLKSEIERREKIIRNSANQISDSEKKTYYSGCADALLELLPFITSFQQEQSEGLHFIPLNRLIQKIPSKNWNNTVNNYAKKLRDCLIKEGYLKDAEVLQSYISYMNGNNVPMATMDEHEQSEVDFEVKFAEFLERKDSELGAKSWSEEDLRELALYFYYSRNDDKQPEVDLEKEIRRYRMRNPIIQHREESLYDYMANVAKHFFELGLNARKEE